LKVVVGEAIDKNLVVVLVLTEAAPSAAINSRGTDKKIRNEEYIM
jgi:hypothetical protein